MEHCDILIVGAGAAGIAAARAAADAGCTSVLLVDRRANLGGVLLQCTHRGFGPSLTGPEYVARLTADFPKSVQICCGTSVLRVAANKTAVLIDPHGLRQIQFQQLILAAGCREIPLGALPIAGTRPAGVYTAGQMQACMNLHGQLPEGPVVILGSGDLGLILAAQLTEVVWKLQPWWSRSPSAAVWPETSAA